jgi:hypothetical protein
MPRRRLDGISCPVCSKLVLALDESGCMLDGYEMTPCRHYIGMAIDGDVPYMQVGFEDLSRAMRLLGSYLEEDAPDEGAMTAALADHVPDRAALLKAVKHAGELRAEDWLACLPEVESIGDSWDGGARGGSGTSSFLFASAPNQRKLVKRLAEICEAVERLPPAPPYED